MHQIYYPCHQERWVEYRYSNAGRGKRVDYILYYKPNIPIAVIEAKDNKHNNGDDIQQEALNRVI